jgi:phospholipid transport system substrate-binding protein
LLVVTEIGALYLSIFAHSASRGFFGTLLASKYERERKEGSMERPFRIGITFLMIWAVCGVFPAWAETPMQEIQETTNRIISIVTDPNLKDPAKEGERRALIRKEVDKVCDWEEMSRRSLGRYWTKRTSQEKKEFVELFGELIERTYIDKVEGYSGQKVNYLGERIDGDYADVNIRVATTKNTEIPVIYKMRKKDGRWWVYDLVIEGVSFVQNYRTQFYDILGSSSYQDLVKKLKEKIEAKPQK